MGFVTPAQCFDVVSLGDVVTDEFIQLPQDAVRTRSDQDGRWLEIPIGAKIVIEDGAQPAVGGSAANAAVAMARLGLRVGLASYLAHDQMGLDILSAMHGESVDTRLIHVDSPSHTVRNFVLSYGGERTILVRHAEFNYHWTGLRANEVPTWLYVNSLGPDALEYQDELADWLDQHTAVRLAFQPGTFQLDAGTERLSRLYARAEVLVCSGAAAEVITGVAGHDHERVLERLLKLGADNVVVFDQGGAAFAAGGSDRVRITAFPDPDPPLDLTGTGDAFASTVVAAMVRGMPLRDALRWAPVNVVAVARQFGAQRGLLRDDELVARLDAAQPPFAALEL
jgi:sugar/nucleoside kinase (ribokinase family)